MKKKKKRQMSWKLVSYQVGTQDRRKEERRKVRKRYCFGGKSLGIREEMGPNQKMCGAGGRGAEKTMISAKGGH